MRIIVREVGNLPTNFGVSGTFRSRLVGQHLSDASRDISILTFDLGGHGVYRRYGSSYYICVRHQLVSRSQAFPFGIYDALLVSALVELVTLTFEL